MSHKHDHKKDKDAFESEIGNSRPMVSPDHQGPMGPMSPIAPMGPMNPLGPVNPLAQEKDDGKASGLTHAAGDAMAHWSDSAGPNKAPIDTLTVADRERKMNKKKADGDADDAGGKAGDSDKDKDKAGKEQTVS